LSRFDTYFKEEIALTLAKIQVATGTTKHEARSRVMLAFNTPFFPDVLVCSRVMGEGVDLHRYCRHVIHHDLDWNPSDIEQRTGRIDRLGCKAEGKHPIMVFLPYLAGTADERQYQVMTEREKWFRVVMGQEEVAKLIPESDDACRPLPPEEFQKMLVFGLGVC
jgi:superfamily II DNA/RNA helicase